MTPTYITYLNKIDGQYMVYEAIINLFSWFLVAQKATKESWLLAGRRVSNVDRPDYPR